MIERWIRAMAKARWLVVALWIAAAVLSVTLLPDLRQIVSQTESKFLPAGSEPVQAQELLKKIRPDSQSESNAVVVAYRQGGLTEADKDWLKAKADSFTQDKTKLGVSDVQSAFSDPSVASKFTSKDGSAMLLTVEFPKEVNVTATQESVTALKERMKDAPNGLQVELTGSAPIFIDFNGSSEAGVKKTETLTIVLVLGILLLVFRSPIAPLLPLLTIGIALVITRGLVALATYAGLPVSTFTETFLIAIMFGAGTDYCILLIHRYREELTKHADRVDALVHTVRTVGRTVLFAGSTVLIAFFLIGFAKFGLYQSAAGVAIGMGVTLLAATTLTPALMVLLGPAMFWPVKVRHGQGHGDSKLWGGMAKLTARRPLLVVLIGLVALAPFITMFHGKRSFDDIAEMDESTSAVKGFRLVAQNFGIGDVLPLSVALTSPVSLRSPEGLAAIERMSAAAAAEPIVAEVRSAARPLGKQLQELTVTDQLGKMNDGVRQVQDGVGKVKAGLDDARTQMASGSDGLKQLVDGASKVSGGLDQSKQGAAQLQQATGSLTQAAASMGSDLAELAKAYPDIAANPSYQALAAKQQGLTGGLKQASGGAAQLSGGLNQLSEGSHALATGVAQLPGQFDQLTNGLGDGAGALGQMQTALGQIADAQRGIAQDGGKQIAGWYLPPSALDNADFKKAMDFYISPDGKTAKLELVLSENPYSEKALDAVESIRSAMLQSLNGTPFDKATIQMTGTTSQYHTLQSMSVDDFLRTSAFVLIGIYLIVAFLLRSAIIPLYVLLSLGFNYAVTMGILEWIFVGLLDKPGLSWTVSFFVFLIIVALGVDYSIFLMARFKEECEKADSVSDAMAKAMKSTGGVIISAAVIMGGTFAALMFSGVNTLVQIGGGIVVGLAIYTTVMMGLIVPSVTLLFGGSIWRSFRKQKATPASAGAVTSTNAVVIDS